MVESDSNTKKTLRPHTPSCWEVQSLNIFSVFKALALCVVKATAVTRQSTTKHDAAVHYTSNTCEAGTVLGSNASRAQRTVRLPFSMGYPKFSLV